MRGKAGKQPFVFGLMRHGTFPQSFYFAFISSVHLGKKPLKVFGKGWTFWTFYEKFRRLVIITALQPAVMLRCIVQQS